MTGSRLLAEESNGNWWKILFFWGGGRELPPSPHTHTHSLWSYLLILLIFVCLFCGEKRLRTGFPWNRTKLSTSRQKDSYSPSPRPADTAGHPPAFPHTFFGGMAGGGCGVCLWEEQEGGAPPGPSRRGGRRARPFRFRGSPRPSVRCFASRFQDGGGGSGGWRGGSGGSSAVERGEPLRPERRLRPRAQVR